MMENTSHPQKRESNIMKEQPNPAEYGQGNSPKSIKTMTQQRRNENYPIQNNCLEVHRFIKILAFLSNQVHHLDITDSTILQRGITFNMQT
jgi:hypothetical protein